MHRVSTITPTFVLAAAERLEDQRDILAGAAIAAGLGRNQRAGQAELAELRPDLAVETVLGLRRGVAALIAGNLGQVIGVSRVVVTPGESLATRRA